MKSAANKNNKRYSSERSGLSLARTYGRAINPPHVL
jgi:hypothetical protein